MSYMPALQQARKSGMPTTIKMDYGTLHLPPGAHQLHGAGPGAGEIAVPDRVTPAEVMSLVGASHPAFKFRQVHPSPRRKRPAPRSRRSRRSP